MNISDFKNILESIVQSTLYVSNTMSDEQKRNLKEIKAFLKKSDNFIDDLRTLLQTRNSENYFAYDKYINDFLVNSELKIKLEILNNQDKYDDVIKNPKIFINIWESLKIDEKIDYLKQKKKYTSIDLLLINTEITDTGNFKDNIILSEILNNNDIRKKIDPFTIELHYSYNILAMINLIDFEMCNILTKNSYTMLLLKKCKNFTEFYNLYESNPKIYNLIANNSLIFDNNDNEEIYKFILENPNFIGKFNNKYMDLFSIVEITKMSKLKTLDNDAFSAILQKLYKYDEKNADDYFKVENLKKCSRHSIIVYPFNNLNNDLQTTIFKNYNLFNRFLDTVMIEAINNCFKEEDIVNILRNDVFVNDMSSYAIELLINKLSFKAAFNMLQRKIIFDKLNNLNVKIDIKDSIFIKGFLDSPILVYKSEHSMLYEMLNILAKDDVIYYIQLPYIMNKLSNYELINLVLNKEIDLEAFINNKELRKKLNLTDIIQLIDKSFEKNINLNIFNNKELAKGLFNLSDEQFAKINFDEVNYLFETVRTKSILSKQESKVTVLSYKSVLTSYLILGLEETIRIVSDGDKDITLDEIKNLQEEIVNEKLLMFKENNSSVFQNMAKKMIKNLQEIEPTDDLNIFAQRIRENTYLDNLIYLMLDNNFDSYNNIINTLYGYVHYFDYDEYASKKDIYEYAKSFITLYLENKALEYNNDFEKIILRNFKVKENVIYNKRKEIGKSFIDKLKMKLFVRALTDPNKDSYINYFRDNYPINELKKKYICYVANEDVDFESILEHVLTPIINDRFDKENCLNKLGIHKPKDTDEYIKYLNDLKSITYLNSKIDKYKETYSDEEVIMLMNYVCYGNKIPFQLKKRKLKELNKLGNIIEELNGEIYIDKSALKFIYKDNMDIYNIDEIIEYNNYLEILDEIISKTKSYINRNMDNEKIKKYFAHDYFKAINTDDCIFPINNNYYEPKKRVFSLRDLETIFNGYDLSNYKKVNSKLRHFLFEKKNLIMVADGYYEGIVDNLGIIISKWDKIEEYIKEFNKDLDSLTLIGIENVLAVINFEDNVLGRTIDKDVIKSICEDGYYEVNDLNKRINMLVDLFEYSFKKVTSTIPYLCYKDDIYKVEILDNYNQDKLRALGDSLYKVGAIGNDFLHYSILNKNGLQIGIYKENTLVSKLFGVRNGNTIYLNSLEGIGDSNYNELLRLFANELISITRDDLEPIEFVTIVNNKVYSSRNGLKLDKTICPVINDPINKIYYDFEEFTEYKNLLNPDDIYTNYKDNISTLLASSLVVDKNNFKYYDVEDKYYRRRNSAVKLSNNVNEEYLKKIDIILYLCKVEDNSLNIDNICLSDMDTIYLGDDYVIFVTEKKNIIQFVLPYDERALKEVSMIVEEINNH